MTKRAVLASVMSSAAVLVLGWQLGTQATGVPVPVAAIGSTTTTPATTTPRTPSPEAGTPTMAAPAPPATTAPPAPTANATPSGSFTGSPVSTKFGTVQVAISVADGRVTDVTAVKLTDADRRSVQISNRAAPILRSTVLAAQSAKVDVVSGATYTSDAYRTSLQSALDQAGL